MDTPRRPSRYTQLFGMCVHSNGCFALFRTGKILGTVCEFLICKNPKSPTAIQPPRTSSLDESLVYHFLGRNPHEDLRES